jgi:serine/threonine protein kinase
MGSELTTLVVIGVQTRCLLLTQLLEGVVHLRNHGIAHRDIKSDNLFLDLTGMSIVQSVPITTKVVSSDPIHGALLTYLLNQETSCHF